MPGERLSMRKIREVLRLRFGHDLSQRAIARSLQLSAGAVNGYLSRARRAGIGWPVPDHLDDEQLERLLFPLPPDVPMDQRPVPDWGLGRGSSRASPAEHDAGAAVGGIPHGCAGWVWLFLVLWPLPGLGWAAEADATAGPCTTNLDAELVRLREALGPPVAKLMVLQQSQVRNATASVTVEGALGFPAPIAQQDQGIAATATLTGKPAPGYWHPPTPHAEQQTGTR
jgi:hypothetical protein